jgi:WD40 repeat protein
MIVIANESVTSVRTEVWDLETLTKRADIKEEGHSSFRIALSPDGKVLATATLAGQIRLYDLATGKARAVFGLKQTVFALAFAPDGATVVAAGGAGTGGGVVALCDVAAGKERATFKASEQLLSAVAIAPDGAVLATGGNDAVVRFWDLATLKEVGALKGPKRNITALAFSPSGRLLACGAHTIHIYDVPFGAERAALPGASSVIDEVMLFLPDGSLLTSGGREIKLWAAPKPLVP